MLQSISICVYFRTCAESNFLFYVENAIRMSVFSPQSQNRPKTQIWKKAVVFPCILMKCWHTRCLLKITCFFPPRLWPSKRSPTFSAQFIKDTMNNTTELNNVNIEMTTTTIPNSLIRPRIFRTSIISRGIKSAPGFFGHREFPAEFEVKPSPRRPSQHYIWVLRSGSWGLGWVGGPPKGLRLVARHQPFCLATMLHVCPFAPCCFKTSTSLQASSELYAIALRTSLPQDSNWPRRDARSVYNYS